MTAVSKTATAELEKLVETYQVRLSVHPTVCDLKLLILEEHKQNKTGITLDLRLKTTLSFY